MTLGSEGSAAWRRRTRAVLLALTLGGASLSSSPAAVMAETHPFSAEDLVRMARISDPRVAPDGDRIVYVLRTALSLAKPHPSPARDSISSWNHCNATHLSETSC